MGKKTATNKDMELRAKVAMDAAMAPPPKPFVSPEGVKFSGLETESMQQLGLSLLLPTNPQVQPSFCTLDPQQTTIYLDRAFHTSDTPVQFPGAAVLQFHVTGEASQDKPAPFPRVFTVAGKCRFTLADYSDFFLMMRTHEQSKQMNMQPNGAADWPDVRCTQMCPVCGKMAQPNGQTEYYMLIETLWQAAPDDSNKRLNIMLRMVNRLTCKPCLGSLLTNVVMIQNNGQELPMMTVLEHQLPIIPLLDYETNPICQNLVLPNNGAWKLYLKWESSGLWQALDEETKQALSAASGRKWKPNPNHINGQPYLKWNLRACVECNKTLDKDQVKKCSRCRSVIYCGASCQKAHWKQHKKECKPKK